MTDNAVGVTKQTKTRPLRMRQTLPRRAGPMHRRDATLLATLYDAIGNPAGWSDFLAGLTRGSAFNRVTLTLHDATLNNGQLGTQIGFEPAAVEAYDRYYATVNPWLAEPEKRPVGRVVTSEAILPQRRFTATEFFADYCRPQGFDLAVGLTVQQDSGRSVILSMLGRQDRLDREPHLLPRLQRLAPHLLRVAQLNRQLAVLETRAATAEAALDGLATAMLLVNAGRQVVYLNATARRMIDAADGLTLRHDVLDTAAAAQSQLMALLIASALAAQDGFGPPPGGVLRVVRPSGRRPYEVLVSPIPIGFLQLGVAGPLAALFIRDPDARPMPPLDRLRRLYALTAAEARLMQALLAGDTLDAAADRFAIARETVRSHLKSLFSKTGTTSQAELIRIGLQGIATFSESAKNHPFG